MVAWCPVGRARRLLVILMWAWLHGHVLGCEWSKCGSVLTESEGWLTSPCYPRKYGNSQTCRWILRAPSGFVVQISVEDFELEEAPGCIYDRLTVSTGNGEVKFCGVTAAGLVLNSSGNAMDLEFTSDFSVQKRGFRISFRHVAVALRNQKVSITGDDVPAAKVSSSVAMPTLHHLTLCLEMERSGPPQQAEWIFTYTNADGNVALALGADAGGRVKMVVAGATCSLDSIVTAGDWTSSMSGLCVLWASSGGRVGVYFNGNHWAKTCSDSSGRSVLGGGTFRLGGPSNFLGSMYNVRLWDYAMTVQQLNALTCHEAGNVIDWDKNFWDVPPTLAQTDAGLSCSVSPPSNGSLHGNCDSTHLGCPAASSPADSTNTIHATNATHTHVHLITASPPTRMPLTPTSTTSLTRTSRSTSRWSLAQQTQRHTLAAITNNTLTNLPTPEALFYRLAVVVRDGSSTLTRAAVEEAVGFWLNETFHNWTHAASVDSLSVQSAGHSRSKPLPFRFKVTVMLCGAHIEPLLSRSFLCRALLRHHEITDDITDVPAEVRDRISSGDPRIGAGLEVHAHSIRVNALENCPEDDTVHYRWPETPPGVAQLLPCFPNKEQSATRSCMIDLHNFSSFWSSADFSNCTDIDAIQVSAENAAEVAVQLAAITDNQLSREEVSKVVGKVQQLVDVANINTSLASTVVTIISNVMSSPHSTLAPASDRALKAVDHLLDKLQFEGSSVSIRSRRLALGVSAFTASAFNGTSFSAFIPTNATDPQIDFESERINSLAQVTLPSSLLSGAKPSLPIRINFLFFSTTSLFQKRYCFGARHQRSCVGEKRYRLCGRCRLTKLEQDGRALISYVVASSVGNRSISNLQDPVEIHITHLSPQTILSPVCMFWDFSMNGGAGGWNGDGCRVSEESAVNKTVCLCDHLTHFGILMDISGVSPHIDRRNNRILTFITFIGCGVSAIFSAATLLTYVAFEKLRRDYPSKILMNLSASLLLLNMSFLLNGWLSWQRSEALCLAAAALLHYFLLTSFTWMGLESVHMYIALVKVFNTYVHRYILKFCLLGWGIPAVLVGLVLVVDKRSYGPQEYGGGHFGEGSSQFCWIRSALVFYTACVAYFCLVFLLNVAMFIVVMLQICGRNGKRGNRTLREEVVRNLRSVVSLTFLLGMTWAFAFFAWGPVSLVFVYLFAIFNSLQGFFIFFFHCALKENVQKQWRRSLCCARFRPSDNSDWSKTPTNNTKKAASEQAVQSLSSGSFGSSAAYWTSKVRLTPFNNAEKQNQTSPFSSKVASISSSSSVLPVSQMIDRVKGYCSTRSDGF
ncbi:adhesion G-protein coupled receptor G6 [Phyllopteryx taeniolatus]|uniref:adhesion G-protein coupled receptor G6 n=1 Tax=Phyllopteryx taeniolatus TaxID=161469 RepID=UPI002AD37659|nr:adhesion G-protein coupled receptor G6 [Phyllopteryx taeniolatus]